MCLLCKLYLWCVQRILSGESLRNCSHAHTICLFCLVKLLQKRLFCHTCIINNFFHESFLCCICCKSWNSIHNPLCYQTLFQFYPQGKSRNGLYWIQVYFGSIHWTISSIYKIYSISTPIYFDKIFNNDINQKLNLCQSLSCVCFFFSSQCFWSKFFIHLGPTGIQW